MNFPDFTGERFIPGQGGAQIAYEHLHRYRFALRWAAGKDVLDVATGIGYGAGLLARAARRVLAVDLDAASVRCARRAYPVPNLLFLQGDAAALPVRSRAADLAVAFEVLEHVENQEGMVTELARAVRSGGSVLISTPNKSTYSEARNYHNPFHVRELYRDEFLALLRRHFESVQLVEQHVRAGSVIQNQEQGAGACEVIAEPIDGVPAAEATYYLALCHAGAGPETVPAASVFVDTGDRLLQEWEQRLLAAVAELDRLNGEVEKLSRWGGELGAALQARDRAIQSLQDEMGREIGSRDQAIQALQEEMRREIAARDMSLAGLRQEFDERGRWAQVLDGEIAARDAEIGRLQAQLGRIQGRRLYRLLRRLGLLPE
jgi:O-antigen biosynthesis protein